MRETLGRHFDLVVVVWAIALGLGWMLMTLVRADLSGAPWDPTTALLMLP